MNIKESDIMAKKQNLSLLEMILVIIPFTNALGIDRFVMGDMKWGLIRLVVGILTVGIVGTILWVIDLVFLFLGRYQTDMLKYLK
jgi:TM2 domain-containing membrane protein YozV